MGELVALLYLQPMASGAAGAAAALLSLSKPDSGQKQRFPLRIPGFYSRFSSRSISIEITRNSRRESNAQPGRSQNFKFKFNDRSKRYKDNGAVEEEDGGGSGGEGKERKRRWWSDKPPSMEEEEGETSIWEDFIDSLWILKLAKFYGWTLPPMIISALIATGPKAFLMAFALPMGQSVISFALKLIGRANRKSARKGEKPFVSNPGSVGVNGKQGRRQETAEGNGVPRSRVVDDYGDGSAKNGKQAFGGWDVLDGAEPRPLRKEGPSGRKASTGGELGKSRGASDELGKSRGASDAPLLLRLLIAVFPFLASWTKML